ncbi:MAG: hypothetical protein J6328_03005 [Bacilli bacterium]|nr:hypothetical protein [Bacilli bacterium]
MIIFTAFRDNLWLLFLIAAVIILIAASLILIFKLKKRKKKAKEPLHLADRSIYISALGGEDNIVSSKLVGSRIQVELKDDSIITPETLLEAGVASYIKMNKKLTLVVKDNADKVYERIFPSK